ncbi:hypothetical protein FACS1894181_12810 [Bacteroidia bacterium]|nr:hypothetical protein FACS1894181_12810 [Bacteroidia bacterium]
MLSKDANLLFMNLNLIRRIGVSIAALILSVAIQSQEAAEYCSLYRDECRKAKAFFSLYKDSFETEAKRTGLAAEFIFAIAAPEFTQYSYLSNKIETYSLKVFYVQRGKAYSNFSIGVFQMKPSFIEAMENYIATDTCLQKEFARCLFANPGSRQARVNRIERLNSIEWQIEYLAMFCSIVNKKFAGIGFASGEDKLRFYAAAYNCGFHKEEFQIRETSQKRLFPHFSKQKFRYDDLAAWFYKEIQL